MLLAPWPKELALQGGFTIASWVGSRPSNERSAAWGSRQQAVLGICEISVAAGSHLGPPGVLRSWVSRKLVNLPRAARRQLLPGKQMFGQPSQGWSTAQACRDNVNLPSEG
jgi:hypothetical protein